MFQRLLARFLTIAGTVVYRVFVGEVADVINLAFLREKNRIFFDYLYPLYTTDKLCQPASCPCGNKLEAKPYFSKNSKLYDLKTKVSVL